MGIRFPLSARGADSRRLESTPAQNRFGRWLLKTYMRGVLPFLTRFISRQKDTATIWRYHWDSIEACVPPEQVLAALSAARLTQVKRHLELGVFSEYQAVKKGPVNVLAHVLSARPVN